MCSRGRGPQLCSRQHAEARTGAARVGRSIQSVAASKWFGQVEPRELNEIAPRLRLLREERARIERAGQGKGLLVTPGRRVWVNLYGPTATAQGPRAY